MSQSKAGGQTLDYSPELWKRVQDELPVEYERDQREKRKAGKQRQMRIPNDGRAPDRVPQLLPKGPGRSTLGKRSSHRSQKQQPHPSSPLRSEPESDSSSHSESGVTALETEPPMELEPEALDVSGISVPQLQLSKILASKRMVSLQCLPWNSNSCWFDTSLTLLAAAVFRCWPTVQGILVHGNLPNGQGQLGQMLEIYLASMQYSSQNSADSALCLQIATKLASCREQLRALLELEYPRPPSFLTAPHYLWVRQFFFVHYPAEKAQSWLPLLLCIGTDGNHPRNQPHKSTTVFQHCQLRFSECSGSEMHSPSAHLRLELSSVNSHKMSLVLPVYDEATAQQHGYSRELESWLQWQVSLHSIPGTNCWRASEHGLLCSGCCLNYSAMVTLPLVLILQFDWAAEDNNGGWQVSKQQLCPLLGQEFGDIVYDYVGTSFTTPAPSHHTCQFTPDGEYMYSYDGLVAGGAAKCLPDSVASIQHSVDHPCASSMVYFLKGGSMAQQRFLQYQQDQALHLLGIDIQFDTSMAIGSGLSAQLQRPMWRRLHGAERFWLEHPLAPSDFADYEQLPDSEPEKMELSGSVISEEELLDDTTPLAVDCCCGYQGPMTRKDRATRGNYLVCSLCGRMSHEACQRNGWGSLIGPNGFTCHLQSCTPHGHSQERPWK